LTSVRVVDGLISVQANSIQLVQLVKLLDEAMGTKSRIKKDLETRTVSVRFDDLKYEDAVRKIFQGVALDYILVPGEGLIVTAASGAVATAAATAAATPQPVPTPTNPADNPFGNPNQNPTLPLPMPGVDPFAPPPGAQTSTAAPAQPTAPAATAPPAPAPVQTFPNFNINDPFSSPVQGGGGGAPLGGGLSPAPPAPPAGGGIPFGQPFN
jgi:hypothetical protein